jgi:superfamily II DNA or RNA helicase
MPNGIVPRDYQASAAAKVRDLFTGGSQGVIVRQPTGTGKTVLGCFIIQWWLSLSPKHRAIVLCHEIQLLDQFTQEIEDILGIKPVIEQGQQNVVTPAQLKRRKIVVASRATLYEREEKDTKGNKRTVSRLHKFSPTDYKWLVVIDEVHRYLRSLPSCKHILEWFEQDPDSRRIGLTATPERGDKRTLKGVTPDVAADYMLYDVDGGPCAVRDGWAVEYDQRFVVVEGVDFKTLGEVRGDFDEHELEAILTKRKQLLAMVVPTIELVGDRRTITFNVTKQAAKEVAQTFNEFKPGSAVSLDGDAAPYLRQSVYSRHQRGEFQFLCVCGLCREGYNDPGIGAVAVFRPTKSRGLAEQMKGRGCRPLRGLVDGLAGPEERRASIAASDKPNCMIIDLVGVTGLADCATTAHILASGKPDEVIDRANKNALDKDGSVDMGEEIRRAQSEIDNEREKAKQERIEREKREEEEAKRQAKLRGEVRYSEHTVRQGQGSRVHRPRRGARFIWGKFKGQLVSSVPQWYLEWAAKKITKPDWLVTAIQRELNGDNGGPAGEADDVNRLFQEAVRRKKVAT